ncbi:hypothetical protein [Archangium sp.]|uniref:hypothetical protein n=1 Tax=Archangium sp. TaxID=1872627 RepID=UPI002D35DDE2|nr:hypothetical protein [Archangium sp.]HYO54218.1 hypothetical protein [Archangium sp.]
MIAPHAAGIDPGPSHDVVQANQLIEAGLWLQLGGDATGAWNLFVRALSHDPSNHRAREWLVKEDAARTAASAVGALSPVVRPVSVPSVPAGPQPALEVSVILLDETEVAPTRAAVPLAEPKAPRPVAPARTPAPVVARPVAPARTPAPVPQVAPLQELPTLLQGVEELLVLGDVSSAMELLRKAEQMAPGDARLAAARERCAREQQAALEAKLGDLKRVPTLKLRMAELMKLSLDPRTGFLLSRIDGRLSYEALFSVSGMSRLDTLRVLARLLDQDIIVVR